jgi:hypothetical protein
MFGTEIKRTRRLLAVTIVTLAIFQVACNKQQKPAETQSQAGPKTFASPDDAGKAVVEAAKTDNREAMLAIFGAGSKDIIYSGDASEDKAEFAGFVSDYDAMHRWRKLDNGSELLITEYVRVVERRRRAGFLLKAPHAIRIGCQRLG